MSTLLKYYEGANKLMGSSKRNTNKNKQIGTLTL